MKGVEPKPKVHACESQQATNNRAAAHAELEIEEQNNAIRRGENENVVVIGREYAMQSETSQADSCVYVGVVGDRRKRRLSAARDAGTDASGGGGWIRGLSNRNR